MKYILDTHALIWHLEADPQLPKSIQVEIDDFDNDIFISVASLWELTIKFSIGKLSLTTPLEGIFKHLEKIDFQILPIKTEHLLYLT